MTNDPYTDDEYDDTYEKVHGDEPTRDQYTDEATDETPRTDTATTDADEDDDSWLSEGLIGTFLLVGVALFFFPEPATSAVGIAMVAMGVVAWIANWAM
ncbi:hypothetical protein [Halorussus caseinilyticus]|uniref:Uncharacterized protein n=1 Tax=Halorussus caseinilyticus TaxID=3034025 RepID=A0ABD5WMM3_9EURY|nr:hypothetical protein [Halorussus sp. DT72]